MDSMLSFSTVVYIALLVLIVIALKLGIQIVPQSENWIVERLGRYNRKLDAGLHIIIPFFEVIQHKVPILETQLPPDPIKAITHDNVEIYVHLAILYRIIDASKTKYRIENLELGIKTVINGTVRSVIGKTELDGVQSNRRHIAEEIENELQHVADEWGIKLTRVEVTEIDVDDTTREAMQIQLNAERVRRGTVTKAEGEKQAAQLQAEARLYSAQKDAEAKKVAADAEAYAVSTVAKAISEGGASAVDFEIKKIQATAIQELSKGSNSKIVLVPSDVLSSLSGTVGKIASKI
jgi:regulator of protease activity HflC (stomatin/prohibitin superfamily)